jgi:hypothetical protein
MDEAGFGPRLAMWVHNTDSDTWKLWLVPPKGTSDEAAFYRKMVEIVSGNRDKLGTMDAGDTKMVPETHPVARGIGGFIKLPGLGAAYFSGNVFYGFYLPDGIILRSDLR